MWDEGPLVVLVLEGHLSVAPHVVSGVVVSICVGSGEIVSV